MVRREHRYIHVISTNVSLGMSTDTQICMRSMPIAGNAMSRVRRQSYQYSLRVKERVGGCYRVLQSVTECYRVLQSVSECYRVLQSVAEYF